MKLLKTIKDKDMGENYNTREASRAVLFDEKGMVPLLFVSKYKYHKLPGGGIEKDESKSEALMREIKEEVGSEIEIGDEVGKVIEFRSEFNLKQISYCYTGRILTKGEPSFENDEIEEGFELNWVPLDTAISLVTNDKPENYEGKFIQERDLTLLTEAKKITNRI